jgi:hypothetical protein
MDCSTQFKKTTNIPKMHTAKWTKKPEVRSRKDHGLACCPNECAFYGSRKQAAHCMTVVSSQSLLFSTASVPAMQLPFALQQIHSLQKPTNQKRANTKRFQRGKAPKNHIKTTLPPWIRAFWLLRDQQAISQARMWCWSSSLRVGLQATELPLLAPALESHT